MSTRLSYGENTVMEYSQLGVMQSGLLDFFHPSDHVLVDGAVYTM